MCRTPISGSSLVIGSSAAAIPRGCGGNVGFTDQGGVHASQYFARSAMHAQIR